MTRHLGRWPTFVALPVATALLASCSLGARQHQADQVVDAVKRTVAAGPVAGTLTASLSFPKTRFSGVGPSAASLLGGFSARFQIDDRAHQAELTKTSDTKKGAFLTVLFDDARIQAHRPDALPSEARPWYQLELDDLGKTSGVFTKESLSQGASAAVVSVLDPRFLLDLGAGALAGSIKDLGPENVGDVPSEHYAANFDIESTMKDVRQRAYSGHRVERQRKVLHLLKLKNDVHKGDVWVSRQGQISRLKLVLRIEIDRLTIFDVDIDMVPDGARTTTPMTAGPGPDATILVNNLLPIERSAASMVPAKPLLGTGAGATLGGGTGG